MNLEERIGDLGLTLPTVPQPVAAYVPAVSHGDLVYTSGQLPMANGQLLATGQVGADVEMETAVVCARQCALNALSAVGNVVDLAQVVRVIKATAYVSSTPDFHGQSAVANGASELLERALGEAGRHVRSAVGVAALPLNAPVEVELIVAVARTR